jgi:hypothetical protein
VESSSTGDPRLRGALPMCDIATLADMEEALGAFAECSRRTRFLGFGSRVGGGISGIELQRIALPSTEFA